MRKTIFFTWILQKCVLIYHFVLIFGRKVQFTIHEEVSEGTFVGNLLDYVPGSFINLNFIKFAQTGDASALFKIDQFSGAIFVAARIDRETLCPVTSSPPSSSLRYALSTDSEFNNTFTEACELHFIVNCISNTMTISTTTAVGGKLIVIFDVFVIIRDVNDNGCSFLPSSKQTITLQEDVIWNEMRVPLHIPYDPDDVELGYSVNPGSIRFSPVSNTSLIKAINEADFKQTFQLHVFQSSSKSSEDIPNRHQFVGPLEMELRLLRPLDFEQQQNYTFRVLANDGYEMENHQCKLDVVILVKDCNDNPPIFERDFYVANLSEKTAIGSLVFQVNAKDADSGQHGIVVYRMFDAAEETLRLFDLHLTTGELHVKQRPNHRTKSLHDFNILAENESDRKNITQSDLRALRNVARAKIHVYDINDHSPTVKIYSPTGFSELNVLEELPPGQDIAVVDVTDEDSGVNARTHCFIRNQSIANALKLNAINDISTEDSGSIQKNRYKITLQKTMDRENVDTLDFVIRCRDDGVPRLTTDMTGMITVVDINDNAPVFQESSYSVKIDEDTDPSRTLTGFEIIRLKATDADEGVNSEIRYSLDHSMPINILSWVKIDPNSGVLSSAGSIDREIAETFKLVVQATDMGTPPKSTSAEVNVRVIDYNDNPPTFHQSNYIFSVKENTAIGHLIGSFTVSDADADLNADISVTIEDIVDQRRSYSYKNTKLMTDTEMFIPVRSKEKSEGLEGSVRLRLVSLPVNDSQVQHKNRTVFEVHLFTDSPVDRETHNSVSIKSISNDPVGIKLGDVFPKTANLRNNNSQDTNSHLLVVIKAEDRGTPRLTGRATLRIRIEDENDNPPTFIFPQPLDSNLTKIVTSYEEPQGTVITKLYAVDPDAGENGTVRYIIIGGNTAGHFGVDEYSGAIQLKNALSSYAIGEYLLQLEARDCGHPTQSAFGRILIEIDESRPKNSANIASNNWTIRDWFGGGSSDHTFNLYLLIAIVIASCVISTLLLFFICCLLRRSRQRMNPSRHINGYIGGNGHDSNKFEFNMDAMTTKFDTNLNLATAYPDAAGLDNSSQIYSSLPCPMFPRMYSEAQCPSYFHYSGDMHTSSTTYPNAAECQQTVAHPLICPVNGALDADPFAQSTVELLIATGEGAQLLNARPVGVVRTLRGAQSPLIHNISRQMSFTLPKAMCYSQASPASQTSAQDKLFQGRTQMEMPNEMTSQTSGNAECNTMPEAGPWCAMLNMESNSLRSTDCDSGHGDSIEVVPCVGLSYFSRVPLSHVNYHTEQNC